MGRAGGGQRPHPACLVPRSRSASRLKSPRPLPCRGKCPLPSAAGSRCCSPLLGAVAGTQRGPPREMGTSPWLPPGPTTKPGGTVAVVPLGSFPSPRQGFGLGDGQARSLFPRLLLCLFYWTPHFEPDRLTRLKLTSSEYARNNLPTGKGVTAQPSTAASRKPCSIFIFSFRFPVRCGGSVPR